MAGLPTAGPHSQDLRKHFGLLRENGVVKLTSAMKQMIDSRHATFVHVSVINPHTKERVVLFEESEIGMKTNIYSVTKSFVGLCIAKDFMEDPEFDVTRDQNMIINTMFKEKKDFSGAGLIDYVNHVSGIVTGSEERLEETREEFHNTDGKIEPQDLFAFMTMLHSASFGDGIENRVHGVRRDVVGQKWFSYNNYGSAIACYIYESMKTAANMRKAGIKKVKRNDLITHCVCAEDIAMKFNIIPNEMDSSLLWESVKDHMILKRSLGHSGIHLSGHDTVKVAEHWYENHIDLLKFVIGAHETKPNPHIVTATQRNVNINDKSSNTIEIKYKYSFGCWIPQINNKRYFACIGMFGQLILIDVDTGLIAVRRHVIDPINDKHFTNAHPEFFIHVSKYHDAYQKIMNMADGAETEEKINQIVSQFEEEIGL